VGRFQARFTPEQRELALDAYKRAGAAQAARELPFEIHATTIRRWACDSGLARARSERTAAATEAAKLSREERAEQIAAEALEAAGEFLARAREANPSNARLLAAAMTDALRASNLLAGDPTDRLEVSDLEREIERELRLLSEARKRNVEVAATNGEPR